MTTTLSASSIATFAPQLATPMKTVASPTGQFGATVSAAQARAALMTPKQRADAEAKIKATAKDFEAQFVGSMMTSMFQGVDFGGGEGAEAFKSVMMQAVGKKIAAGRGIGMAHQVQAEMMKLQGLS